MVSWVGYVEAAGELSKPQGGWERRGGYRSGRKNFREEKEVFFLVVDAVGLDCCGYDPVGFDCCEYNPAVFSRVLFGYVAEFSSGPVNTSSSKIMGGEIISPNRPVPHQNPSFCSIVKSSKSSQSSSISNCPTFPPIVRPAASQSEG